MAGAENISDTESKFNPGQPMLQADSDKWWKFSRPITSIQGNKATGELIGDIGKIGTEAIQATDKVFQIAATDAAEARGTQEHERALAELRQVNDALTAKRRANVGSIAQSIATGDPTTNVSILSQGGDESIPQDVKNIGTTLETLKGARERGMSQTDYKMRVDAALKDVRAQYPGYRRYVDAEMERVTGVAGANSLMQSLVQDINNNLTRAQAEKQKDITFARENLQFNGVAQWLNDFEAGKPEATHERLYKLIADPKKTLEQAKLNAAVRDDKKGDREETQRTAEDDLNKIFASSTSSHWTAINSGAGLDSEKEIYDLLQRLKANPNEQDAQLFGIKLHSHMRLVDSELDDKARLPAMADGRSYAEVLGGKKLDEMKQSWLGKWNELSKMVYSGEYGLATSSARFMKAMEDDIQKNTLFKNADFAKFVSMSKIMKEQGPEVFDWWNRKFFNNGLDEKLNAFFQNEALKATTQPGEAQGQITTMQDTLARIKAAGLEGSPKTINKLVDQVELLADKRIDDQTKRKVSEYAFDLGNHGFIEQISKEGSVDMHGKVIKLGQWSVWNRMTSDEIANEEYRLGGNTWKNYKGWVEGTFRNMFGETVRDLNTLGQLNPNLKITYHSDTHQWGVDIGDHKDAHMSGGVLSQQDQQTLMKGQSNVPNIGIESTAQAGRVITAINNLNNGMRALHTIAQKDPHTDVDAYLFGTMTGLGYDLSKGQPAGIPQGILTALTAARQGQQEKEEAVRSKYEQK